MPREYKKRGIPREDEAKPKYRKREKPEEELHTKRACSKCGETLMQLHWNTSVDLLLCDNLGCSRYRQPQGTIPIVKATMQVLLKEEQEVV